MHLHVTSPQYYLDDEESKKVEELEIVRKELNVKANEILQLKEELSQKKVEITELQCKLGEKEDKIKQNEGKISEQDKELTLLKNRLKDFEIILDNPEMLEETKKQLEDTKAKYADLEKTATESSTLSEQLTELKAQNEELLKERVELKASLFAREQRLMQLEKANPAKETGKKYQILEEIKNVLCDALSTYATMQTMAKEVIMIYSEKANKAAEYELALEEYTKENNKKERLKKSQDLEDAFAFLSALPKKMINIGIIDKCIIDTLKAKVGKAENYKGIIERYEKLLDVINQRFSEYELKLSHY